MPKVALGQPACGAGCMPCELQCALIKFMLAGVDREIATLQAERPPRSSPAWPAWQDRFARTRSAQEQLEQEFLLARPFQLAAHIAARPQTPASTARH